jgi:hypothetical protein
MKNPTTNISCQKFKASPQQRSPKWRKRRGVAFAYLAVGMLVFLGVTGLVVTSVTCT